MLDLQQILYTLKQDYGAPVALYKRAADTVDLPTGDRTVSETKYGVRKAVVLPINIFIKYYKLVGNADFNYGGDLSIMRRIFIVDRRDLPRGLEVTNEFNVVYNHVRFSIELLDGFDNKECYYISGKQVAGADTAEQIEVSVQSWVYVADQVGATK